MRRLYILLMSAICLASCSIARFQPVSDTSKTEVRVDSVMVYDSVYIDRIRIIKAKADTVYVTDVKTEYKYKYLDRVKVDTLILTETKTETQFVEKELTPWQTFRLKGFWVLAGLVVLWIVWKIIKLRLRV